MHVPSALIQSHLSTVGERSLPADFCELIDGSTTSNTSAGIAELIDRELRESLKLYRASCTYRDKAETGNYEAAAQRELEQRIRHFGEEDEPMTPEQFQARIRRVASERRNADHAMADKPEESAAKMFARLSHVLALVQRSGVQPSPVPGIQRVMREFDKDLRALVRRTSEDIANLSGTEAGEDETQPVAAQG